MTRPLPSPSRSLLPNIFASKTPAVSRCYWFHQSGKRSYQQWIHGIIVSFDSKTGTYRVHYDDGDEEDLNLLHLLQALEAVSASYASTEPNFENQKGKQQKQIQEQQSLNNLPDIFTVKKPRVSKFFCGKSEDGTVYENWYDGKISSYNQFTGHYRVKYDDGDSEDMDLCSVLEAVGYYYMPESRPRMQRSKRMRATQDAVSPELDAFVASPPANVASTLASSRSTQEIDSDAAATVNAAAKHVVGRVTKANGGEPSNPTIANDSTITSPKRRRMQMKHNVSTLLVNASTKKPHAAMERRQQAMGGPPHKPNVLSPVVSNIGDLRRMAPFKRQHKALAPRSHERQQNVKEKGVTVEAPGVSRAGSDSVDGGQSMEPSLPLPDAAEKMRTDDEGTVPKVDEASADTGKELKELSPLPASAAITADASTNFTLPLVTMKDSIHGADAKGHGESTESSSKNCKDALAMLVEVALARGPGLVEQAAPIEAASEHELPLKESPELATYLSLEDLINSYSCGYNLNVRNLADFASQWILHDSSSGNVASLDSIIIISLLTLYFHPLYRRLWIYF
ncbi:hypothetical protein MPSEU_000510700 [Mayamaea pseudoterrestris]|nr:hypothetical protein MPSEU_000510700 [Mayamaea pseudoterrestris]